MNKFEICVPDYFDKYHLLDFQHNRGWLWGGIALKINNLFYEVNFFTRKSIEKLEIQEFPSYPNFILIENLTLLDIENSVQKLIETNFLEHIKEYKNYEDIKFFHSGRCGGAHKSLSSIFI